MALDQPPAFLLLAVGVAARADIGRSHLSLLWLEQIIQLRLAQAALLVETLEQTVKATLEVIPVHLAILLPAEAEALDI